MDGQRWTTMDNVFYYYYYYYYYYYICNKDDNTEVTIYDQVHSDRKVSTVDIFVYSKSSLNLPFTGANLVWSIKGGGRFTEFPKTQRRHRTFNFDYVIPGLYRERVNM